ncbi:LysR family transcriptional regulator [Vagococcus bubulae]|uniref:LysR family transcriptional regulator n=1 Tax=Vagococcus bubulae TaxID=1977868 RepID=A0A429ZPP3_9ENTE|nr:LysR family transcriptional regulator [Vagococcus bubulae]RST95664.1 LysR family transcriptional regulator [Vagococcus bubulae]
MELRVLTYFLTVAKEKNISRAAKVLHLSQPTLSKQLKELENELGVTLFTRGNREITLTEEGNYLKQRGEEILSLVQSTTSNLMSEDVIGGQLMIGSGETRGFQIVASVVNEMHREYPSIKCNLYSGNADEITRKIDEGLLDFGLVIDPVQKEKYDCFKLPYNETWGVLLNKEHPLASNVALTADNLLTIPLFISNQAMVENQIKEWQGNNIPLNIIGFYNLLYNASLLCHDPTVGILCIDGIINTTNTDLCFVELSPKLQAFLNLIWKKDTVLSNTAKMFLKKIENIQL